jgi:ABC-type glycerol-3-phosphate transport system substrate-binding protein
MQQPLYKNHHILSSFPARHSRSGVLIGIGTALLATGCAADSTAEWGARSQQFQGVALSLRCPDPAFVDAISPAALSWAKRNGATLTIHTAAMRPGDDTDVGILNVPELGTWAERGELARVPASLRLADNPYQWTNVLSIYREQLSEWGGQAQAVPLAGDGYVVVYRTDRLADPKFVKAFQAALGRSPGAPATWEDFADLAIQLAVQSGKPSLPPMTGSEIADLFFRISACYDRPAMSAAKSARQGSLSLQFDPMTGNSRLDAPAFSAAGALFDRLAKAHSFASPLGADLLSDPIAALGNSAALGVVSLGQLARLPRDNGLVPGRYGIAALPGTGKYHESGTTLTRAATPNYVPYFSGGRIGVVRTRCVKPEAAFELLAALGGPARSLEMISTPRLGAGPFRLSHLESDRLPAWYGYGFDAARTKGLQQAMQSYVRQDTRAPALGLRGPDQATLSAAAARELSKLTSGTPSADVLRQLTEDWKAIDAKTPLESRLRWRKMSAGIN